MKSPSLNQILPLNFPTSNFSFKLPKPSECDVPLCLLQKDNGFVSSLMRIILALLTLFASLLFYISIKQFASGTMMMSRQQFRNVSLLCLKSYIGETKANLSLKHLLRNNLSQTYLRNPKQKTPNLRNFRFRSIS